MIYIVILFTAFSLFGTLELFLLTLGALLAHAKKNNSNPAPPFIPKKTVVVIPAYNEEFGIHHTINSLKKCPEPFDIYVIADNCTDNTAKIAKELEVNVIERFDPVHKGKHFALKFAFDILLQKHYELFAVIDADTAVSKNLMEQIQAEFSKEIDGLQVFYGVLNDHENLAIRFMKISYLACNLLRPLGRNFWGFSCGVLGNGFAVTKKTLLDVPFNVQSIVEDLNYHLALVEAGKYVKFTTKANVLAEMPIKNEGRANQRARWEKGRFYSALLQIPKLTSLLFRGHWRLIEPLFDLMTLPLSYHVLLLLMILMVPFGFTQRMALISLLIVAWHLLAALKIGQAESKDYFALLAAPFYLVWKILLLGKIIKKKSLESDRAQRRNE
jgi:cellulose synthase/poly-beta-1,6-N-acetylglucosamine synthase-like glycosyltransferase